LSVLLEYTEEFCSIRRIRLLVHTSVYFRLNQLAKFIQPPTRNRYRFLHPDLVFNRGNFYWREEVFSKASPFRVFPCEGGLMQHHKVVHLFTLFRPSEVLCRSLVDNLFPLLCIPPCRNEVGRIHRQFR